MIEQELCQKNGISQQQVDDWDKAFIPDEEVEEPGDDINAPYAFYHLFATTMEKIMAKALGVDWKKYERALEKL